MLSLSERELADISGFVKGKYGVNLASKRSLIESRLGHYIQSKGFGSFGEYFSFVLGDASGTEVTNLINLITTNHTFFMRENDHFEIFTKDTLPWIESLPNQGDLRVWCAGCATGEEPYTISINIMEYMTSRGFLQNGYDTTILASDISEKALLTAAKGVYPGESLSAMPPEWILKYFVDIGNGAYRVSPGLRKSVAFKKINLLDPIKPKKPFHAIFCRNVMIYFDAETRLSLVARLYEAMAPGAYLFVGHSESLANCKNGLMYISPSVYRKPFKGRAAGQGRYPR
ncbi:MAG: protein-glutamate O-methyltransferase CheR [Clostridiales bacterium]|nr:protein-glutamate O-methyltransferase CheR [Clostridiales bacterium]